MCRLRFHLSRHTCQYIQLSALQALWQLKAREQENCLVQFAGLIPVFVCANSHRNNGYFGTRSLKFIKDLGKRIALRTGDPLTPSHLIQRLAVEIQRGNSSSILSGTYFICGFVCIVLFFFYTSVSFLFPLITCILLCFFIFACLQINN